MSTQKQNEDVKNSNARIAIGDLNAKGDVRGGLTRKTKITSPIPEAEFTNTTDGKDVSGGYDTTTTP